MSSVNFNNGTQLFNIDLDSEGNLNFNANDIDGRGSTRLSISDNNAQLTIGGSGEFGDLQLRDGRGSVSIRLNGSTGNCSCTSLTETSDLRLKKDIAPLVNALDKVLSLRGVHYQWNHNDSSKKLFNEEPQIGFIGQEMETVCPELVSTDDEGYKSLNYSRLTPILVEAIKEQQQLIHEQKLVLEEAMKKIVQIEATLKGYST